jgi:hypothetical protein
MLPWPLSMPSPSSSGFRPRLFVRGDVDGFFGLALDNLIQVLLISSLWTGILGQADVAAHGAFALEQGFLLTSMVWAALTVEIIERRFGRAALWALGGAALSLVGLVHSYAFAPADTVQDLAFGKAWPFALGYTLLAGLLVLGRRFKQDETSGH